jgi:nitrogen fixation protein NifU and related proteins
MYSPQLLDHFEHPRNPGEVTNPDARVCLENPACGDMLQLSARVQNGRLVEIRFKAKGCVPVMACASLITELATGKSLEAAAAVSREDLIQQIGGLPPTSGHAAQLAVDAVLALVGKLKG